MSAVLAFSVLGCDKKDNDTEETEKTSEETSEISETTIALSKGNAPIHGSSEEYGCIQTSDELNAAFLRFKQEAQAIHNNNDGRVLLFGFGKNVFREDLNQWEYVFLVYSPNDGLKAYEYYAGDVVEIEYTDLHGRADDIGPEKFMLTYEDFMDFPAFYDSLDVYGNFLYVNEYDVSTYETVPVDGEYQVRGLAVSEDLSYLYGTIGHEALLDRSMEDCLKLSRGEFISIRDEDYLVDNIIYDDVTNVYEFALIMGGTRYLRIRVDEEGIPLDYSLTEPFFESDESPVYENMELRKIPISPDCVFEIEQEGEIVDKAGFLNYLEKWGEVDYTSHIIDSGYSFTVGAYMGTAQDEFKMVKSVIIKDGQIVYVSIYGPADGYEY